MSSEKGSIFDDILAENRARFDKLLKPLAGGSLESEAPTTSAAKPQAPPPAQTPRPHSPTIRSEFVEQRPAAANPISIDAKSGDISFSFSPD